MNFFHLFIAVILGAALPLLDWDQLPQESRSQEVLMRGFTYQTSSGQWILSPDPHLKSCCVGATAKAKEQVLLFGDFTSLPKAVAVVVQGHWHIRSGQKTKVYVLENAALVDNAPFPFATVAVGLGFLLIFAGYWLFTNQSRNNFSG